MGVGEQVLMCKKLLINNPQGNFKQHLPKIPKSEPKLVSEQKYCSLRATN